MEKEITKIVITGGPCAGKSTGLAKIEEEMTKLGYKVIMAYETATQVINSGLNLYSFNGRLDFQRAIFKLQLLHEDFFEEYAKKVKADKVLIVFDRGLLDNNAFLSDEDYELILRENNMTRIQARDRYDGVFHLVTAAKGVSEFYTLSNNKARTETVEEAIAQDDRLISCYAGHPHLRIIDNDVDFDLKISNLINEIVSLLGMPEHYECERKFLIKMPDLEFLNSLPNCKKVEIIQTYLKSDVDGEEVRVRQRGEDNSFIFTLTRKKTVSSVKRLEIEKKITQKEYLNYLLSMDTTRTPIRKTRYCLLENGVYFEIDTYPSSNQNAICEVEFIRQDQEIVFPEYINVLKEVTDDASFKNSNMSRQFPEELL